ncbi:hypothetical protein MNBD_GAMMA23-1786 [hydrothermal vent metagenome]|uniref:Cytochrome c oxidase, subunit I n=1 Tax=hydrothermal vent metagenome TaxID=652676 RepID=A0A3B1AR88_9ZZZZ
MPPFLIILPFTLAFYSVTIIMKVYKVFAQTNSPLKHQVLLSVKIIKNTLANPKVKQGGEFVMATPIQQQPNINPNQLPFVAPYHQLETMAAFRWIKLGWQDFKRAPRQSITYGFIIMLLSYISSFCALEFGNFYSVLSLVLSFLLLGPIIAIGLYSISSQLQEDKKPILGYCLREGLSHFGNIGVFILMLMVVFLIWARAASMLHVFYPIESGASFESFITFLSIGTSVGAVFSFIIFTASAFSLPMIMDKKVDTVTAVVTSVSAVLHNKKAMLVWSICIFLSVLLSFATAFIGLLVFLPVIGHATWHAYKETIDASQWPGHS